MNEVIIFIGRKEALKAKDELVKAAKVSGLGVRSVELDPLSLKSGFFGTLRSKSRLRTASKDVKDNCTIIVLECAGDKAWAGWMVQTLAAGLRRVAVPMRLLKEGQIAESRSGFETYEGLDSLEELKDILKGAFRAVQELAYVAKY